jgi:glycosyltransferase involved in cell wall biosynthesis
LFEWKRNFSKVFGIQGINLITFAPDLFCKYMPLKVLIISSYKGPAVSVRPEAEMLLALQKQGVHIDVMTREDTYYAKVFKENGMQVFPYRPSGKLNMKNIRQIRSVLKKGRYDIMHVFSNKAVINAVHAALGLPVKVITYRGFTGHVHWYKPTSYLGHLHPKVSKITCVSNGVREQVRKQFFFNKKKAITVYKGHKMQWYEGIPAITKKDLNLPDKSFVVGCVANARPMKGVPYLLKATHHLKNQTDIHLLLIGKGMDTPAHLDIIKQSPLAGNIHLSGFQENVLSYLTACDMTVLPSIKGEGLSKVLIESMSMKKPVVATDIGGNAELVVDGKTGLLIPPRSPEKIANAILKMKSNPEFRSKLASNARLHIENHFSMEQTVREMKTLYEELSGR